MNFVKSDPTSALYKFTQDPYFESVFFRAIVINKGIPSKEEFAKIYDKNPDDKFLKIAKKYIDEIPDETRKEFNFLLKRVLRKVKSWGLQVKHIDEELGKLNQTIQSSDKKDTYTADI